MCRAEENKKEVKRAIANLKEMRVAAYKWVRKAQEGATAPNCPDCGWTQDDDGVKHLELGTTSGLKSGIIKVDGSEVSLKHVGLYVHCYPHCSVNSLHLHIVDEYHTEDGIWSEERQAWDGGEGENGRPEYSNLGPTYDACRFKNLHLDRVIEALEKEANPLKPGKQGSARTSGNRLTFQGGPR